MTTGYTIKNGLPHIQLVAGKSLDYTFDLTDVCEAAGADIASYAVVAPPGVTASNDSKEGNAVTTVLTAAIANNKYPVHLDFTYTGTPARTDRRTIVLETVSARM